MTPDRGQKPRAGNEYRRLDRSVPRYINTAASAACTAACGRPFGPSMLDCAWKPHRAQFRLHMQLKAAGASFPMRGVWCGRTRV